MINDPDILYKFKRIDEYALKSLSTDLLYFSSRAQFNDPLDSNPCFEFDINSQELAQVLECLTERKGINPHRLNIEVARDELEKKFNGYLDTNGILSMSARYDNALMWSHYADEHKGICLGYRRDFDREENAYYKPLLRPVRYDKPRSISYSEIYRGYLEGKLTGIQSTLKTAYFSKAPNWWYENEWRYIHHACDSEARIAGKLDEVIFGWRTPLHMMHIVMKIVLYSAEDVVFYKMEFVDGSFEMERLVVDV